MKDKLGGKMVTEFAALRPKTYGYLTDDDVNKKKQKLQKSASLNENLNFKIIKIV